MYSFCCSHTCSPFAEVPAVVVGVVGMGHVPGIERNWDQPLNINEIMRYVLLFFVQDYFGI